LNCEDLVKLFIWCVSSSWREVVKRHYAVQPCSIILDSENSYLTVVFLKRVVGVVLN